MSDEQLTVWATCEYGKHPVVGVENPGSLYCYTDVERGLRDIKICKECLFDHVHKYWPGCANEQNLLKLYPELDVRNTPAPGQMWLFPKEKEGENAKNYS